MSYRSFKRVLGETNLERKCRFLFGACLLLLITASFWWYGTRTDALVMEQNRRGGRGLVQAIMAVLHWEKLETNEMFKPVVEDITANMRNEQYEWRTIKPPNPEDIGLPQDEFEWDLMRRWQEAGRQQSSTEESNQDDFFAQRHFPEKNEYQYYQPIFAKKKMCIDCHRTFASAANLQDEGGTLQEGDLMAIVKVSLSDKETVEAQLTNRMVLLVFAIITVFLAMIALYVIVRYVIVKPLKHLRDVSDEITQGHTELRADIRTGDEFEDLGRSFNRMLQYLNEAQEKLHNANENLDGKVDQLAQANMRLYEMNRLKSDFLATVSHELRTPLNSIIGFSDVLKTIESLDEKQQRYVQNIQRSGQMLLEMINDILDLAKIESGKMEVRLSEFQIGQVIAAQCDMARPLTERKNIDLEYELPDDLPPMKQDQAKVQQILSNLLSNAIKFTPEGGRITITARREHGELTLIVDDTGVGIAEEDQTTIFEKFRQGGSVLPEGDAMTREYSGTGLGLSIVRELCRLLGGEVTLQSELGKGSAFTVRLPWTRTERPKIGSDFAEGLSKLTKPQRIGYQPPGDQTFPREVPSS